MTLLQVASNRPEQRPSRGTSRVRFAMVLGAMVALLATMNVLIKYGPAHSGLVLGPVLAGGLIVLARRHGLSWEDLGLARRTWAKGATYAGIGIALVGIVYLVGAVVPATQVSFLDVRYRLAPGPALLTALVVIPIGTVLLEEVAFRGVLLGLVDRHHGIAWATVSSSVLFGLWHILPSLRLGSSNQAAVEILGSGVGATIVMVLLAVGFTAGAGVLLCELRRRSGSLFASVGLHWATNGLGVLVAAGLWTLTAP